MDRRPEGRATVMDEVRKYMEATLQKLSPAKAQEMARSVMQGQGREQVQKFAQELMDWSNKSRERFAALVQREVKAQMTTLGVASRDEVDALKKRVRELEREVGAPRRSTAKRAPAKRATAKKPRTATPKAATPAAG